MEFGLRELLVGLGVLVILAIVFDAIRRHRRHKNPDIRMDLDLTGSVSGDPFNHELPAGGARQSGNNAPNQFSANALKQTAHDISGANAAAVNPSASVAGGQVHDFGSIDADVSLRAKADDSWRAMPANEHAAPTGSRQTEHQSRPSAAHSSAPNEQQPRGAKEEARDTTPAASDVLGITVLAQGEHRFAGQDLVRQFISAGLRFGQHDVFHLYDVDDALREAPLISVTNAMEPRTFKLSAMPNFSTTAIALYLPLPGPKDPEAAFGRFLTLADTLAKGLDGQLCDLYQKPLTQATLTDMHQRLLKVCELTQAPEAEQKQADAVSPV